jgi:tetratricopeptide (TPR) repeat protein
MTTPANPSNQKPAGDDRNLVAVDENYKALTFEDTVHQIWTRNRKLVFIFLVVVLALILGKGGWEYMQQQRELDVEKAYAAATNADQLKAFAAAHPDHALAGIAYLRVADEAYAAGKSADAVAAYDKVLTVIKSGPLAARAQLGRGLAKAQSGKAADAAADLKLLANDTNQVTGIRAEAAYQLASLAAEQGNAADVGRYVDDLMKIDPSSSWAQRGMMLRMSLPAEPAPQTAPATSATSTPAASGAPAPKKDAPKADMQIKLPGK